MKKLSKCDGAAAPLRFALAINNEQQQRLPTTYRTMASQTPSQESRRSRGSSSSNASRPTRRWPKAATFYAAILILVVLLQLNQQAILPSSYSMQEAEAILPQQLAHFTTGVAGMASSMSQGISSSSSSSATATTAAGWDPENNPLGIPPGQAVNLPSIRETDAAVDNKRKSYGGTGDKKHLGGFTDFDVNGISPALWKHMVSNYGIKSFLDVGCGKGTSTTWWLTHGADVLCVEGSHDAVKKTFLPDPAHQIVEHDFARGPWWPTKTYDAAWSVEFLEHVNLQYHFNYVTAFRKAALLFVTSSRWGGWHHVEVHPDEWWIRKYESYGFKYDQQLTDQVRKWAKEESNNRTAIAPNGNRLNGQHIWLSMKVFVNPAVAALPRHAHLFPQFGCYGGRTQGEIKHRECGTGREGKMETPLDKSLYPLELTPEMDLDWENLIRHNLGLPVISTPVATTVVESKMEPQTGNGRVRKEEAFAAAVAANNQTPKRVPKQQPLKTKVVPRQQPPKAVAVAATPPINSTIQVDETVLNNWRQGYKTYTQPITLQDLNATEISQLPQVPVVLWPYLEFGIGNAESLHIEENGVKESKFLQLAENMDNFDPNVVWVGDTGYAFGWNLWCGEYLQRILTARARREKLGLPLRWPIYIVDFTDGVTKQRCKDIEKDMGTDYVKYFQRSVATRRHWDFDQNWIDVGKHIPLTAGGVTYRHTPLVVRTDTIEALQQILTERGLDLSSRLEDLPRPRDVAHFWPADWTGVSNVSSILRTSVSRSISDFGPREGLNIFVGLAGDAVRNGRRGVKTAYIEALLGAKIVVVTQRDDWEDHYRLFEALISGALVMTDRMLGMPAGLVNGTSILEFGSEADLEQKILYYLKHDSERKEIARLGREVAMTRHRTWHRIEDVIFGRIMSTCSPNKPDSPCPWIVHAKEARTR